MLPVCETFGHLADLFIRAARGSSATMTPDFKFSLVPFSLATYSYYASFGYRKTPLNSRAMHAASCVVPSGPYPIN